MEVDRKEQGRACNHHEHVSVWNTSIVFHLIYCVSEPTYNVCLPRHMDQDGRVLVETLSKNERMRHRSKCERAFQSVDALACLCVCVCVCV